MPPLQVVNLQLNANLLRCVPANQKTFQVYGARIVIDNVFVAKAPAMSVTFSVKVNVPTFVGLPEITPVLVFRVRPGGRAPAVLLYVNGVEPALMAIPELYATPCVPFGIVVVVIVTGLLIVMLSVLVAVAPVASVTLMVNV